VSADLFPTKTRVLLLLLVSRSEVVEYAWDGERPSFWLKGREGRGLMVTNRMGELRQAGWVQLPAESGHHVLTWELTEAGRKVLEANHA